MNIESAKQKWCPFARALQQNSMVGAQSSNQFSFNGVTVPMPTPQPGVASANRIGGAASWDCKCLADGCMAWRTVLNDPTDGHCGLAGFAPHGGGE